MVDRGYICKGWEEKRMLKYPTRLKDPVYLTDYGFRSGGGTWCQGHPFVLIPVTIFIVVIQSS